MSKGIKFLIIGCLSVLVIGTIVTGVSVYLVGSWFKKKADTVSEYGDKMDALRKEHPFTAPSDNAITESQLTRFLQTRKDVYSVWKQHEAEMKKLSNEPNPNLGEAWKSLGVFQDLRLQHAKALEEQRMSPDEYSYLMQTVYVTWMAKVAKDTLKEKSVTEGAEEILKQQIATLDKQIQDSSTNAQVRKQLQAMRDQLQTQLENVKTNETLKQADQQLEEIPQANLDLFVKHRAEIEKYAMPGLDVILIEFM